MDIELCRNFFASRRNYTVFAGFSGGADSTAALLIALCFAGEFNLKIIAVHFDHHLRGAESDGDALWCRDFAGKHGIEFRLIDLTLPDTGAIEDAARQARLQHWIKLAGNRSCCSVMLGHHADDRIENFFLRILRGSNLSGLISPKAEYRLHGVDIFRPLLPFSRKEIEAFLCGQGIDDWRIDSTNKQSDCSRNILRLEILPALLKLFPGASAGISQCLKVLEQDADFIDTCAAEKFDSMRVRERTYWQKLHPALLVRILRLWKKGIPSADFVSRFLEELALPAPAECRKIPWSDTEYLCFQNDLLYWQQKDESLPAHGIWSLENTCFQWKDWQFRVETVVSTAVFSKFEAVFDADLLGKVLYISLPCPGERMTVFGTERTEKIKKLRVDSKIPAHFNLPVIKNEKGEIVWAPGIKHSALAAAGKGSKHLLKISAASAKFGICFRID